VGEVVFRDDEDYATPRAVELTEAGNDLELQSIDSVLFRHFHPCGR
jgi:hypothetical protein